MNFIYSCLLVILAQSFVTKLIVASDVSGAEIKPADSNHLMIYRNLFKVKRKEHLAAVQKLLLNPDIAKKSALIKIMLTAIIKTIKSTFDKLEDLSLNYEEDFPSDMTAKDVFSQILENTALFTDIIIRFPHISRPIYQKSKKSWKPVMRQAIEFCNQSPVFDGDYQVLLHNLRQELEIGVPDVAYQNPFEEQDGREEELSSEERKLLYKEAKRKKKVKDSTKKRSAPKVSSRVEL